MRVVEGWVGGGSDYDGCADVDVGGEGDNDDDDHRDDDGDDGGGNDPRYIPAACVGC
jgi:hypothetical protein